MWSLFVWKNRKKQEETEEEEEQEEEEKEVEEEEPLTSITMDVCDSAWVLVMRKVGWNKTLFLSSQMSPNECTFQAVMNMLKFTFYRTKVFALTPHKKGKSYTTADSTSVFTCVLVPGFRNISSCIHDHWTVSGIWSHIHAGELWFLTI